MLEVSIAMSSATSKSYLSIVQDLGQLPQDGNIVKIIGLHRSKNEYERIFDDCVYSSNALSLTYLDLIRTLAVMEHCGSRSLLEF